MSKSVCKSSLTAWTSSAGATSCFPEACIVFLSMHSASGCLHFNLVWVEFGLNEIKNALVSTLARRIVTWSQYPAHLQTIRPPPSLASFDYSCSSLLAFVGLTKCVFEKHITALPFCVLATCHHVLSTRHGPALSKSSVFGTSVWTFTSVRLSRACIRKVVCSNTNIYDNAVEMDQHYSYSRSSAVWNHCRLVTDWRFDTSCSRVGRDGHACRHACMYLNC